jgi:hypothetical protein
MPSKALFSARTQEGRGRKGWHRPIALTVPHIELGRELLRHLDDEEDLVIPLLLERPRAFLERWRLNDLAAAPVAFDAVVEAYGAAGLGVA